MIVFHLSMEGEMLLIILMGSVMYLHCNMQDEDILEQINGKGTLLVNLLTIV